MAGFERLSGFERLLGFKRLLGHDSEKGKPVFAKKQRAETEK
jgi:hypothetical protein